jgi:hypothetical protein
MSMDLNDFLPETVPEDSGEPVSLEKRAVSHDTTAVGALRRSDHTPPSVTAHVRNPTRLRVTLSNAISSATTVLTGAISLAGRTAMNLRQSITERASRVKQPLAATFQVRTLFVFALVMLSATVWLLSMRSSAVPQRQPQVSQAEQPLAVPAPPVESAPVSHTTTLEPARPALPGTPPPAAPSQVKTTSTQAGPMSKSAPRALPPRAEGLPRPALSTGSTVPQVPTSIPVRAAVIGDPQAQMQTPSAAATESTVVRNPRDASEIPASMVYSAADADVAPPVQIYPRFAEATEHATANASPIEIVVDESGRVQSAVLARRPANMGETVTGTMMIGAAKTWRFRPATKDGQPVKYRRILWFSRR